MFNDRRQLPASLRKRRLADSIYSLGLARPFRRRVARDLVREGGVVLHLGCGDPDFMLRAAAKGAEVRGFDESNDLLRHAQERVELAGLDDRVQLWEAGPEALCRIGDRSLDLLFADLCLSRLFEDELFVALKNAGRVLQTGGRLAIADRVRPPGLGQRAAAACLSPLDLFARWLDASPPPRPIADLAAAVAEAGFVIDAELHGRLGRFVLLIAIRV